MDEMSKRIKDHERLVRAHMKRWSALASYRGVTPTALKTAGYEGVWRALTLWERQQLRGTSLNTHIRCHIDWSMKRECDRFGRHPQKAWKRIREGRQQEYVPLPNNLSSERRIDDFLCLKDRLCKLAPSMRRAFWAVVHGVPAFEGSVRHVAQQKRRFKRLLLAGV